jgi:hypothetical protein
MPLQKRSKWGQVVSFVNEYEVHEIFTRKEMLAKIADYKMADTYLYRLRKSGFVKKVGRGQYMKMYHVPITLTTSILKDKSWRTWFMNLPDRLGINEEDCPRQDDPFLYLDY